MNKIYIGNTPLKLICAFLFSAIGLASIFFLFGNEENMHNSFSSSLSPGCFSQDFLPLDPLMVMKISETKNIVNNSSSGTVAIATYFPGKDTLIAVHTGDGILRKWNLEDNNLLNEYNLGIVSSIGVEFDESGDTVMGPMLYQIIENDFGEVVENIGGVAIWDTNTGKLIYCVVNPCNNSSSKWQRDAVSNVTLDSKKDRVFTNREIWISVSGINDKDNLYSFSEGGSENPKYAGIIDIDSIHNRYAIAYRDGEVIVGRVEKNKIIWILSKFILGKYEADSRHNILALNFSPSGNWLARIQDDIVSVWRLKSHDGKLQFEHNIPQSQLLAFNPSSELLFIGSDNEIYIWNLINNEFIKKLHTPLITTLSISSDNRLLIWGDKLGVIHVWGIKK